MIVVAVLLTALLGLSGVMVSRQLERDLARQVRAASDGRELEPLVEAAVEEAHYQLMIGTRPGATGAGPSEHDPVAFLREATGAVRFAPSATAAGMDISMGVELFPVEVQVVDRQVGAWQKQAAALPTLFSELRTTWGVVELRALARWPRYRGPTAVRRLTVRRLFTVVDHVFDTGQAAGGPDTAASGGPPAARPALRAGSGQPRGYAHLFPGEIARVMEGE